MNEVIFTGIRSDATCILPPFFLYSKFLLVLKIRGSWDLQPPNFYFEESSPGWYLVHQILRILGTHSTQKPCVLHHFCV